MVFCPICEMLLSFRGFYNVRAFRTLVIMITTSFFMNGYHQSPQSVHCEVCKERARRVSARCKQNGFPWNIHTNIVNWIRLFLVCKYDDAHYQHDILPANQKMDTSKMGFIPCYQVAKICPLIYCSVSSSSLILHLLL